MLHPNGCVIMSDLFVSCRPLITGIHHRSSACKTASISISRIYQTWTYTNHNRIECNWNKTFVNLPSLTWKPEISGAVHLAQPALIAGRKVDEIQVNFEIFKIHCTVKPLTFRFV